MPSTDAASSDARPLPFTLGPHRWLPALARAAVQLLGTLLLLTWVPTNLAKVLSLLAFWWVTLRPWKTHDLALFSLGCVIFTGMNAAALRNGVFIFSAPDWLRMPIWELFMWGFYLLHFHRLLAGQPPGLEWRTTVPLVTAFAACFAIFTDPTWLLLTTASVLALALLRFHEPLDWAYAGYAVVVGAAIEYVGVYAGLWHYPTLPANSVPLWFVTMWGGVGLWLRRLALPLLAHAFADQRLAAPPHSPR